MTLRFIDFLENEPKPGTTLWSRTQGRTTPLDVLKVWGLSLSKAADLNFEWQFALLSLFKLTEYIIRSAGGGQVLARLWRVGRSMFNVRCSFFS